MPNWTLQNSDAPRRTPQIYQTPFGKYIIRLPSSKMIWSTCGLIFSAAFFANTAVCISVNREGLPDVAFYRLILHPPAMLVSNNIALPVAVIKISPRAAASFVITRYPSIAACNAAYRVYLADPNHSAQRPQCLRTTYASTAHRGTCPLCNAGRPH